MKAIYLLLTLVFLGFLFAVCKGKCHTSHREHLSDLGCVYVNEVGYESTEPCPSSGYCADGKVCTNFTSTEYDPRWI